MSQTTTFTLDDLREIMRAAVGVDDGVDLGADILDTGFPELGYDSLAVLELTSLIGRRYDFEVPDELVERLTTPRSVVDYVNDRLVEARS
ncbi:acyl carrier protein [Actinokineospora enzanensis]|uniref:acyl carrier protein n=1 Tax=Actinokineospora enzanensis TaxID=155975 RepID=UPI0003788CA9|nr:phosphopantetheine-binding protein [Actinokineospora enzanensis]